MFIWQFVVTSQAYPTIDDMGTLQSLIGSVYSFIEQSACRSERFRVSRFSLWTCGTCIVVYTWMVVHSFALVWYYVVFSVIRRWQICYTLALSVSSGYSRSAGWAWETMLSNFDKLYNCPTSIIIINVCLCVSACFHMCVQQPCRRRCHWKSSLPSPPRALSQIFRHEPDGMQGRNWTRVAAHTSCWIVLCKLGQWFLYIRSGSHYVSVRQVHFRTITYILVRMCNRIDSSAGCWDAGADLVARNSNGGGSWFWSWSEFSDLRFSGSIIAEMAR